MVVKGEREKEAGVYREREEERGRGGLVTIILEIKDLSACSACSPPLQLREEGNMIVGRRRGSASRS